MFKDKEIELRRFGIALSLAMAIILLRMNRGQPKIVFYLYLAAVVLLSLAVFLPRWLKPLHKIMQSLANIAGTLIGWIVLTVIFYLIITPLGFLSRLRRDPLYLNKQGKDSYWLNKEEQFSKDNYKKQF